MAATRTADAVLSLCHKATVLGNKIAIHMLEYLGTVEKHSHQFDDLANEFMDTSRIMWSLEAGLSECTRSGQRLPAEMIVELDRKFRTTTTDFQVLDQILGRFLDYEKKGTVGKLQKGWRNMFSSNDVERMRENLEKTREALRMSALVFQWYFFLSLAVHPLPTVFFCFYPLSCWTCLVSPSGIYIAFWFC